MVSGCVLRGCVQCNSRAGGGGVGIGLRSGRAHDGSARSAKGPWEDGASFPLGGYPRGGALRTLGCLGWLSQADDGSLLKLHDMFTRREDAMV